MISSPSGRSGDLSRQSACHLRVREDLRGKGRSRRSWDHRGLGLGLRDRKACHGKGQP